MKIPRSFRSPADFAIPALIPFLSAALCFGPGTATAQSPTVIATGTASCTAGEVLVMASADGDGIVNLRDPKDPVRVLKALRNGQVVTCKEARGSRLLVVDGTNTWGLVARTHVVARDSVAPGTPVTPVAEAFDLNDVSILLPLARDASEASFLPSLSLAGPKGPLIEASLFARGMASVVEEGSPSGLSGYAGYRIVGFRFDPCTKDGPKDTRCAAQIRLVAQPLEFGSDGAPPDLDAAVHLIYLLDAEERDVVVSRLAALKVSSPVATAGRPLGIHPGMAEQGLRGTLARDLRELVRTTCGQANLVGVAFTSVDLLGDEWAFSKLDRTPRGFVPVAIPTLGGATRMTFSSPIVLRNKQMEPEPRHADRVESLFARAEESNPADFARAFAASFRVENPAFHGTATMDCGTCHVTTIARENGVGNLALLGLRGDEAARFRSPGRFSLERAADGMDNGVWNTRLFGYFRGLPSVGQRVINESAIVARSLSKP